VGAQIILTGCEVAGLEDEECTAFANGVLERCVGSCPPDLPCESRCAELAEMATLECEGKEGLEGECAEVGAAVLAECLAHCEGEPVPSCDEQCDEEAAQMLAGCLAKGLSEAECSERSQSFLESCRKELGEFCQKEQLALESTFQPFLRGDSDGNGTLNISDPIQILGYLFLGAEALTCRDAADANDDGKLDVSDPVSILGFLFLGAEPLPEPYPGRGQDPTGDVMVCAR
jgi:hypothetical protein